MMVENDIAFPSLKRLAADMGVSVKNIVVYRKILVSYGLIKKIIRRKDENGSYQSSLYQLVRFDNTLSTEEEIDDDEIEKFKEVLLYILGKVGSKPNIGQTVLYKLLYFIDFNYYEKYEE